MDLIREELLRQQKALELLLLGTGPQAEPGSPSEKTREISPGAEELGAVPLMPDTGGVLSAEGRASRASLASQESRGPWESWESLTAAGRKVREAAEGFPGGNFGTVVPSLDAAQTVPPGTAAAGVDLEGDRLVTEYVLAGRSPGTGARELSRLFERDARRYDGGFPS